MTESQEKVREYIKDYYKDKVIDKSELLKLKKTIVIFDNKTVNLADLLKFCTPYLPEDCKHSERLYNIINDIYEKLICPVCNINNCKFNRFSRGYFITCSENCSYCDVNKVNKMKKTNLKKYGVENSLDNNDVQNKRKTTLLNRYGTTVPLLNKDIYNKKKTTIFNNKNFKQNKFNNLLLDTKRLNNCTPLFDLEEFKQNNINTNYKFKWQCNVCNTVFYDDLNNGHVPVCPKCYKKYGSNLQKEIYEFLQTYNLNIRLNDRRFKFEIDLYLKDYNLGIEVNGNYWHSDLHGKDKYYHLNKTLECAKNNINLIHIFEDDWLYRQDIVKNIILDKLNLITNTVDNLDIYKITDEMSAEFLNNNCIYGNIKDNTNIINYGLCDSSDIYYLISIDLTNSKIVRYCSKLNYKIDNNDISKLILHMCKENNLENFTVYCDLRYDTGELFKSIGFNYLKFKHPTYDFIHIKDCYTRINKENLVFENYDDKLSIWYNAMNNNYDRIWNCGYLIFNYII